MNPPFQPVDTTPDDFELSMIVSGEGGFSLCF
jgi:hypothetical protein